MGEAFIIRQPTAAISGRFIDIDAEANPRLASYIGVVRKTMITYFTKLYINFGNLIRVLNKNLK